MPPKVSRAPKSVNFRNPVYIIYAIFGLVLLWFSARTAGARPTVLGKAIIQIIGLLPGWLHSVFVGVSAIGSLTFVLALALLALIARRYKASVKLLLAGFSAYVISVFIHHLSEHANNSFPATPVAIATALALVSYQYVSRSRHRYITLVALAVVIAQLYLGKHTPIDSIGGFAIGLSTGSAICYVFGRRIIARVAPKEVYKSLLRGGYPVKSVDVLGVDARGSSPFIVSFTTNARYFVKVVNRDNFVADWLFKVYRRVAYRRLEDEAPFFGPKQQIEHETYVANLAYANGVRTPKIIGVLEVKPSNWAQIQEAIDGKSLDKIDPTRLDDVLLDETFKLVDTLHSVHIIHRDLRAANIFLDSRNTPWLIDFGFAEASISPQRTYLDLVEMICSLGVLVGADRIVKAAIRNVPKSEIVRALPYMQIACLSGETTRLMKQRPGLLPQILDGLRTATQQEDIRPAKIARFSLRSRRH